MNDNARPHHSHFARGFLQNDIATLHWPVISPDLNPLEHIWDFIGHRVQARDPSAHHLAGLEAALKEEWQQLPLDRIWFTGSMQRMVQAVIRSLGGYTRY